MKQIGVYIHIPFCKKKCFYCDFLSFADKEEDYELYVDTLVSEIKNAIWLNEYEIISLYIGGGTPTVLPVKLLSKIINALNRYKFLKNAEISIEANPCTLNISYLRDLRFLGIKRLSIGLQAYQNELLKNIGRAHTYEEFWENYNNSRKIGFNNINIDLMFSINNQNLELWEETLNKVSELEPEHISAYSLIIESNTKFGKLFDEGKLNLPDEDTDRKMYSLAKRILKEKDYLQYEISNFSKSGFESIHNMIYWTLGEYIGFGMGAHSFVKNIRFSNTSDFEQYVTNENKIIEKTKVTEKDSMEEFIFLGLRMTKGISTKEFTEKYNKDIFELYGDRILNLASDDYISINNGRIYLTDKGIDVSNTVFSKILV